MKERTLLLAILSLGLLAGAPGCVAPNSSATSAHLQKSYKVERGRVIRVKPIIIDDSSGGSDGAVSGASTGAIVGAFEGESVEGALVGALVGGVLGGVTEAAAGREKGYELDVRKEDGTVVRILQREKSLQGIRVGDLVEILTGAKGVTLVNRGY